MPKKLLFLSHYAGRTGAPIFLLQLVTWLKTNTDLQLQVVHLNGGDLLEDFRTVTDTALCMPEKSDRYVHRLYTFLGIPHTIEDLRYRRFSRSASGAGIDLIYSNTICNGAMLARLAPLGCPVICHVHELEAMIRFFGQKNFEQNKACATHYIAASGMVKQNLVSAHGIPEGSVDVVYPCINTTTLPENFIDMRPALGIPEDAFVAFGSGKGISGIKGKDLFIQLAHAVAHRQPELAVHFIWVGGERDGFDEYLYRQDVERAGLAGRLHLIYDVQNPLDYFNAGNVIVSVSREEVFGLVNLEAAALGKPIICFDKGGGIAEFVEHDAGCIVPYLNIPAMAEKVIEFAQNPELVIRLGRKAAEKIRLRHDSAVAFPGILKIVQRFL